MTARGGPKLPPIADARRLAREVRLQVQLELVEFFASVVRDPKADMKDRLAAAKMLMVEEPRPFNVVPSPADRLLQELEGGSAD